MQVTSLSMANLPGEKRPGQNRPFGQTIDKLVTCTNLALYRGEGEGVASPCGPLPSRLPIFLASNYQ